MSVVATAGQIDCVVCLCRRFLRNAQYCNLPQHEFWCCGCWKGLSSSAHGEARSRDVSGGWPNHCASQDLITSDAQCLSCCRTRHSWLTEVCNPVFILSLLAAPGASSRLHTHQGIFIHQAAYNTKMRRRAWMPICSLLHWNCSSATMSAKWCNLQHETWQCCCKNGTPLQTAAVSVSSLQWTLDLTMSCTSWEKLGLIRMIPLSWSFSVSQWFLWSTNASQVAMTF